MSTICAVSTIRSEGTGSYRTLVLCNEVSTPGTGCVGGKVHHRKVTLIVLPKPSVMESGPGRKCDELVRVILVGIFGMHHLALQKLQAFSTYGCLVVTLAPQVHLDTSKLSVIAGNVCEVFCRQVTVQQAIEMVQDIKVEFGRCAIAIIVSGVQYLRILLGIDTDQQPTAVIHVPAQGLEKSDRCFRLEVTNRGTGIEEYVRICRQITGEIQAVGMIANQCRYG